MEELDQRAKSIIDNTRKAEFYGTALHTTRQRILRQEKIVPRAFSQLSTAAH